MKTVQQSFGLGILLSFLVISGLTSVHAESKTIILATTTSTQDSGLLDVLLPIFQKRTGYFVKTIAVGSGQAIVMGQKGEADLLLVHSPAEEKRLVEGGHGVNRRPIMYNDYLIVGPIEDLAKIKREKSAIEAFRKIGSAKRLFLSRGDHSGTHEKEKSLWNAAGINPERERWYQQTGLGMGQTLNVASEKGGYTLVDRGTYLALKKKIGLDILVEGDPILLNPYHVIEVSSARWPQVNSAGAKVLADFLVSKEAQKVIKNFGVEKYGAPLYYPAAGKKEEELGK